MDTTPDCIRARKINTDKRMELMHTGKCFTCKNKDTLVVIALKDLLIAHVPIHALAPSKLKRSIVMMKNQPK